MVPDEEVEPPEDRLPDPQDTMADVSSDPPCIDSAPAEQSEPQAKQAHGRQRVRDVGSRICTRPDPTKYRGDHRKFQWVVPVESIIGKVPVVPVGDTGTVPHGMGASFPGAYGDSRPGAGDGCRLWYVN